VLPGPLPLELKRTKAGGPRARGSIVAMALPASCRWLVVAAVVPILSCTAQAVGTVAGGSSNTASGDWAFVGAGEFNLALGDLSSVTGGTLNTASGYASTVLGGEGNDAIGGWSMAMGSEASATHDYSGVMSFRPGASGPCSSVDERTLTVCADNGLIVNTVNVLDVSVRLLCIANAAFHRRRSCRAAAAAAAVVLPVVLL
jgi:hypothetical protein